MIHVIEKKILPPFEERSSERKNFWLDDDTRGLFFSSENFSSIERKKKWSSSLQREIPHPRSDKVFSTRTVTSQHSNRRFWHQTLHLHHQRRQFYKQEEEWFQNFSAVKKNFEHDRQHVNNVTRVAISESEDVERWEVAVRHRNSKKNFSLWASAIFFSLSFSWRKKNLFLFLTDCSTSKNGPTVPFSF